MPRYWTALIAAVFLLCVPRANITAQQNGTLRVKVTVVDTDGNIRPVPRHALLVSINPTSAAPQRMVTTVDGTAQISLRPGNYTVESENPMLYQLQAYEWSQTVDIVAGQTTTLELTAANAMAATAPPPSAAAAEGNTSGLLLDWQHSVVTIWTPTKRGAGFLVDSRGLIATNQRLIGTDTSIEVQLSPTEKVAARVLAADPEKNVAVLWIDPTAAGAARPMKLRYADAGQPPVDKQKVYAITSSMDDDKSLSSGTIDRISARAIFSGIRVDEESLGAPLLNTAGEVIAITTADDEANTNRSDDTRAVRIDDARAVIAAAEKKMTDPPSAARLPVEPQREFDDDALRDAAGKRKGVVTPYRVSANDFEVHIVTPLLIYSARHRGERTIGAERGRGARSAIEMEAARRVLQDFGNWWDYVRRDLPVLMIRATPKLVEPFWRTLLRGTVEVQGVSLPPIKSIKAGFARMRVFCGDTEVAPIHPFKIEHRIGATDAVYEGLYVLGPDAIGPQCGTAKLVLFSDKAPDKGDTRVIDPKVLQQIWEDFAPYRAAGR